MSKQHLTLSLGRMLLVVGLIALPALAGAADTKSAPESTVTEVMTKDLINGPGKEIVMLTVTYAAAGASLPHRHDAQVLVYVLEGELRMQVRGGPVVTLRPGQSYYEAPTDIHVVSANNSKTDPARILVVMIKDKGSDGSRLVTE